MVPAFRAFTLIELVVVLGVLSWLGFFFIPVFSSFLAGQNLRQSSQEMISVLKTTQGRALAGREGSSWGVYFPTPSGSNFVLFRGSSYVASTNRETHFLPSGVTISVVTPRPTVVFSPPDASLVFAESDGSNTLSSGTLSITLWSNAGTKIVKVEAGSGRIYEQ